MPLEDFSIVEQEALVARQLKRQPAIKFQIETKCAYGWPAVVRNLPVTSSGEPNPNLYYLTCPWLRRELARLEDSGYIDKLQRLLISDHQLDYDTKRAQKQHVEEYRAAVRSCGAGDDKVQNYIAGSGQPRLLKCLHAQMAFYLVHQDYLLGRAIAEKIGELWCPDQRCSSWMAEIKMENMMTEPRLPR